MAVHPPIEPEVTEPALRSAAEALRSLAHCIGILTVGLLAGFLARSVGGGIVIDGIALAVPAAMVAGAVFLAFRAVWNRGLLQRNDAPAP